MKRALHIVPVLLLAVCCTDNAAVGGETLKERAWPGKVETYQFDRSIRPSAMYDVVAGGETQRVFATEEPHICTFGCSDTVCVVVDYLAEMASSAVVRPLGKNPEWTLEGGKMTLSIAPGDKYVIEFNGNENTPLFIFANPLEGQRPDKSECAYYFEAGKTYTQNLAPKSGKVYFEPGSWVSGQIHVENAKDVEISGYGILYGVGGDKPMFINKSESVSVDGLILVNHDFWSTLAAQSKQVKFLNYKVVAPASSNEQGHENDALDILGCTDVEVRDCMTYCHDDALCIKSQKWLYSGIVDNVVFENCICWNRNNGSAIEFGAELNQNLSNILFKDIWVVHSGGEMSRNMKRAGISFKHCAGGDLSGITLENIFVEDAKEYGMYIGIYKSSASIGNDVEYRPGTISGIKMKNIHIDGPMPYGNASQGYDADVHSIKNFEIDGLWRNGVRISTPREFFTSYINSNIIIN